MRYIYPYLTTRKPFKYRNPTSTFTLAALARSRGCVSFTKSIMVAPLQESCVCRRVVWRIGTPIRYAFKEEFEPGGQRFFGTSYSVTGVIFAGGPVEGDVSLPARGQDVRHSGNVRRRSRSPSRRGRTSPGERYRLIVQGGFSVLIRTPNLRSIARTPTGGC